MPSARQPAPALRDRAERHVFAALPELPAIERRVLALLELAGAERAAAGAEVGLEDEPLRLAAQRARKTLRRTLAPLAAGGRCERAELLHSDRLDAPLSRADRRWLEIHLARCPRCAEHVALLGRARAALRESFAVQPAPADAPPVAAETSAADERRLRAVPPPPAATPTPPEPPGRVHRPPADKPGPTSVGRGRRRGAAAQRAARVLAVFVVLAGLAAGGVAAVGAIGGDDGPPTAPWARPGAPEVAPAPLSDQ